MHLVTNKLLVTRYGGCGDMIMMEPAIEALYYKHSPAEVYLRTHPHYSDLHRFHPLIEDTVEGILTAGPSAPGFPSDEKKPNGYDYFFNTTGSIEMNRGIHGMDSFAFAVGVPLLRRTPVLYLDPNIPVEDLDIVVHTPGNTSRNNDFRLFDVPLMLEKYLKDEGITYRSVTPIGGTSEAPESLQAFARAIAGASLFVGPDSAGAHIASALSIPSVVGYTSEFPASIRAYHNTISVNDNNLNGLLRVVGNVYQKIKQPEERRSEIPNECLKFAAGYYENNFIKHKLTEDMDWRNILADGVKKLPNEGRVILYENHKSCGGFDMVLLAKFMIETLGLTVLEYTATADIAGKCYIVAKRIC